MTEESSLNKEIEFDSLGSFHLRFFGKWFSIIASIALLVGSASALFLVALEKVTEIRESKPWFIYFLPLAGFAIGWFYFHYGKQVHKGNNLLIEEIHSPTSIIPIRMTPFVFLGTLVTHLFGGSAGREGTAVQMGGSIAHQFVRLFPLSHKEQQTLIILGMSAGFASVFGTPFAAAIFSIEVIRIGTYRWKLILPTLITAYLSHLVCLFWGVSHSHYPKILLDVTSTTIICLVVIGILSGWVARFFSGSVHTLSELIAVWIEYPPLRPFFGGIILVVLFSIGLSPTYFGLGLPTIQTAFVESLPWESFLFKLLLTAITIGSGFKGGEVTPLFFIGASLGNIFGFFDPAHLTLFVGIGFISVFAGASNTPLASAIMGMELFGWEPGIFFFFASLLAYIFSGHSGIYRSQKIGRAKFFSSPSHVGKKISELKK
ncbi:chloride transporter, ClC family [Leptospira wolbachii serovar Codice str. CDC]|uniref:Chloride transporter, ClC family n=1 Tax=Leptospira wolbachii serovar Codice str. CDC TaxID=1218599 RepID=R9A601_9LEPT|nr:chloride channel protein [Leptospira wolbachii]EOQ97532.1 chloride transporter, ClC family [Leptospira wolbachii serovar Codice str. CDC]